MIKDIVKAYFENEEYVINELVENVRSYKDMANLLTEIFIRSGIMSRLNEVSYHQDGYYTGDGYFTTVLIQMDCGIDGLYYSKLSYGSCCACDALEIATTKDGDDRRLAMKILFLSVLQNFRYINTYDNSTIYIHEGMRFDTDNLEELLNKFKNY